MNVIFFLNLRIIVSSNNVRTLGASKDKAFEFYGKLFELCPPPYFTRTMMPVNIFIESHQKLWMGGSTLLSLILLRKPCSNLVFKN